MSLIFSVRSCTSSALSCLLSLSWSCSTFLVGVGVCLYVAWPFFSSLHALIHALSACVLHHLLNVVLSGYSWGGGSAGCWLRPSSLHPVASLAAWSAASFPGMPTWAGIHRTVTEYPLFWSSRVCCAMSARMYAPDRPSAFAIDQMAAWLSVYMAMSFSSPSPLA